MTRIKTVRGWIPLPISISKWYKSTQSMVLSIMENNPKMNAEVARLLRDEWRRAQVRQQPFLETWIEALNGRFELN